jgi:hypothetical protein
MGHILASFSSSLTSTWSTLFHLNSIAFSILTSINLTLRCNVNTQNLTVSCNVWPTWVKILRVCHLQFEIRCWSAATVWTVLRLQNRIYKPCPHILKTENLSGFWNVTDTLTQEYFLEYTQSIYICAQSSRSLLQLPPPPSQPLRNTVVIGSIIY